MNSFEYERLREIEVLFMQTPLYAKLMSDIMGMNDKIKELQWENENMKLELEWLYHRRGIIEQTINDVKKFERYVKAGEKLERMDKDFED